MSGWRALLTNETHAEVWRQVKLALGGTQVELRFDRRGVWVRGGPSLTAAWNLMELLEECHRHFILAAARQTATPYTAYKPLERHVILAAMLRVVASHGAPGEWGPDPASLSMLLHETVWAQGLPNANHRSALLMVQGFVHMPNVPHVRDDAQFQAAQRFVERSKPLVADKEFVPGPEAKAKHLATAQACVEEMLGLRG